MAITLSTLFTRLGKIFFAAQTLQTSLKTTVPDEVEDVVDQYASASIELVGNVSGLPGAVEAWRSSAGGLFVDLQTAALNTLVQMVDDDNAQPTLGLEDALAEVRLQMIGSGSTSNPDDDVDQGTVAASPSADGGNNGNGVMVTSITRGDGEHLQNGYAEDIICTVTAADTPETATFECRGESAVDLFDPLWPKGSGASLTLNSVDASQQGENLIANGSFEDETALTDQPDDWELVTGTAGTHVKITAVEVQTVAISGTPGSGDYVLTYTDPNSKVQLTSPLDYDASQGDVQAALRALTGLEDVTVATTGTSPNFTHTITFTGVTGNPSQLTSTENFDQGSIGHATTTAGNSSAHTGGKALEIDSNGSTDAVIQYRLDRSNLESNGQYACNIWAKTDSAPAAGVLKVGLWDGSDWIDDDFGTENSFTIDCTGLTTSYVAQNDSFRIPKVIPDIVYLRIATTTSISNTSSVYLDDLALVEMQEFYDGGPLVAIFSGATDWALDDKFTVAVTNNRAGGLQEWFWRFFATPSFLLPSDGGGNETIADSLIA